MTDWEQFEAWIELRIMQRRATRGEVYALRLVRRSDTRTSRTLLIKAYTEALFAPLAEPVAKATRAFNEVGKQLQTFSMRLNLAEFEMADIREFDNRARDWIA